MRLAKLIKSDFDRYVVGEQRGLGSVIRVLLEPGFTAGCAYRIAHQLSSYPILHIVSKLISLAVRVLFAIEINPKATVGPGLLILHGAGVVIGGNCVIGDQFTINQGATVGGSFGKTRTLRGVTITQPRIGNFVHVAAGAKILGPIVIGDEVVVGANAVVVKDVPARSVVGGVPARIIRSLDKD